MLDPAPYRSQFPICEQHIFLNHAGVSALSRPVVEAMHTFSTDLMNTSFTNYIPQATAVATSLRQRAARLINAPSVEDVAFIPNTAYGINSAALSLPLRPGDNVLVLDGDYPANVYPWMNLAHRGVLTKLVPTRNGGLDIDLLVARMDARTRVVALSTVQFATGFRNDLEQVGRICHERGIFFVVDGIQSLGAFDFDVQACHVDMLACGSQKWLMGPLGAGFMYVRRELLEHLIPGAYVGAASTVDWINFLDYNLTMLPTAERFNLGSANYAGMVGLDASLALIEDAGIQHVKERVLMLSRLASELLQERGYTLACAPTSDEQRSGIVIAEVDNPAEVSAKLAAQGVVTVPRGKGVRFAPHFYNTEDEIRAAVAALDATRP